jgi:hypothetical protein
MNNKLQKELYALVGSLEGRSFEDMTYEELSQLAKEINVDWRLVYSPRGTLRPIANPFLGSKVNERLRVMDARIKLLASRTEGEEDEQDERCTKK